ncbi:MAG: putative 2OG-Fe(II) oxygenase [Pseudomonadota bacterium]
MVFATPGNPQALLNDARALLSAGRLDEAAQRLQMASMSAPTNPAISMNLGIVELKRRHFDKAAEAFGRAAKTEPGNAQAWMFLAEAKQGAADHSGALEALDRALSLRPTEGAIVARRAEVLALLGKDAEAADAYRILVKAAPKEPGFWHNLGNVLMRLEDFAGARDAFGRADALKPDDAAILYGLGRAHLFDQDYEAALPQLAAALERAPHKLQIISYKIICLRHLGRNEEADALEGLNDLVVGLEIEAPKGFSSVDAFNQALSEEILNHSRLTEVGRHRATRNGAKLDNMFDVEPSPLFQAFEVQVRNGFDRALAAMPNKQGHPLPLSPPDGYRFLNMWSNVMHRGGHQAPHNHPSGWFSACYYNLMPQAVETSGDDQEGWIEFGGVAYDLPGVEDAPVRRIKPEPGMLVVFPSYIFHRTIPFESDEIRISCACDARPGAWPNSVNG